jgi:hypothetical protein
MTCLNPSNLFFDPACAQFTQALAIIIALIGMIGAVLYAVIKHWRDLREWIHPSKDPTKLDVSKINVCLAHAHVLEYRGAKGRDYEDTYRIIDPRYPIYIDNEIAKEKVNFAFGVDIGKENVGIPFHNVRLNLELKAEDNLEVTVEKGDGMPAHTWQCHLNNHYYWYEFSKPINERWVNTWNTISIKFLRPGDYLLTFRISGNVPSEIIRHAIVAVLKPL